MTNKIVKELTTIKSTSEIMNDKLLLWTKTVEDGRFQIAMKENKRATGTKQGMQTQLRETQRGRLCTSSFLILT